MRVLQVSSDYFNTSVYQELFSQLKEQISIRTIVPIEGHFNEQLASITDNSDIRVVFKGRPRVFGAQINSLIVAKEIINSNVSGIDLIHSHYILNDGAIAMRIFKITGIPYVVSIRASCLLNFKRKLAIHNYFMSLQVLAKAELIYVQSYSVLSTLLDSMPIFYRNTIRKKVRVISNGIDDFWLKNKTLNLEKRIINNKLNIITVASIEQNKNLIIVAELIDRMNLEGYQIKYFIAGRIKDISIFNKLTKYKCVEFLGELDKTELLHYYRKSHIFIMLSHFETFGLVYAEALSQSLPIIYTVNQGFDGQFEEGTVGYHCSSNDSHELHMVIIRIVDNYEKLVGNTSSLVSRFNWESIAMRYIEDYKCILVKR